MYKFNIYINNATSQDGCVKVLTGSATVFVNPLPTVAITTNSPICSGKGFLCLMELQMQQFNIQRMECTSINYFGSKWFSNVIIF